MKNSSTFYHTINCLADEVETVMVTYRGLELLIAEAHQIEPREIAQLLSYLNDHLSKIYQEIQQALEKEPQAPQAV